MELHKKQIKSSPSSEHLKGKTIDEVYFDGSDLIIVFTDNTFIHLSSWYSRQSGCRIESKDSETQDIFKDYNYVIEENKDTGEEEIKFTTGQLQTLIDLGIWSLSEEEINNLIAEKREYYEYLRLKEKFEGRK